MSKKDLVSEEVLQELTNKIQEIVNNYCHNLEYFTDSEVDDFFQASADEVTFYNGLINDKIESQNFLWSSKHVAEKIAQSILEANEYTNSLLKNISSIQLEWCETNLPTTGENNKIYILPVTSESTTVNTLNIWNSTTCEFISIGNLEIDLTNYYTKTETDEKLELKANADEVISNDKIVQTLDSTTNSSDTILSTSGLQVEMDKKIDKANIVNVLDSTVTNTQLIDGKTLVDKFNSIDNNFSLRYNYDNKRYASVSDRKSAIKTVMKSLIKDGATTANVDYYKNNALFTIRYNGGYYFTYIMTSYYSKVFLLEFPFYDTEVNIWIEDEQGELFIKGTIPITEVDNRIVNPFTFNTDKYKLYDGSYTLSGKTCTLTVSIDCLSPASSSTDVGILDKLNLKTPSTPRTFDLKAEGESTSTIKFYLGETYCQVWNGTAGKRYTGTVTYTIKYKITRKE